MTDPATAPAADPLTSLQQAYQADPQTPADAFLELARQFFRAGRFAEGEKLSAKAVVLHPQAKELWNVRGVLLRMLRRPEDALAALEQAVRLDPAFAGALVNRGNVHLDLGQDQAALEGFLQLLALSPRAAMPHTMVGRALLKLGRAEEAIDHFREAIAVKPDFVEAWQLLAGVLNDLGRPAEAEAVFTQALAANPDHLKLLEAKALFLRLSGRRKEAEALLRGLLLRFPSVAWIHFHLGDLLTASDPDQALAHLRQALTLEPGRPDHVFALLKALAGSVVGDEGAKLDAAYDVSKGVSGRPDLKPAQTVLLRDLYTRICAFDDLAALGSFETLGRSWAKAGLNAPLMYQMSQADTLEKARELVAQHVLWGQAAANRATQAPVSHPPPRAGDKIRLGFMSSDLRNHPVGRFALPLFEHIDHERFEIFAYAFNRGAADATQTQIQELVDEFRWWPDISAREAAQCIANDNLDMLIELGGPTDMNMPEVMAYSPAPVQASWLGYPHSTGLPTVDYYICDPHNAPTLPGLLVETPLLLPKSWFAVSHALLAQMPPVAEDLPETRRGYLTFGTANNPYKYSPRVLATWARIVAATPGSHFAFIRPEGGSQVFRRNIEAAFAAEGVAAERIDWIVTRGGHMPAYGEVDISLDTFPLTGGTTTMESLMMGVPVVSLRGAAFFERLSHSILVNLGLGDFSADSLEDFQAIALELAADPQRRQVLRSTLRSILQSSPLGQSETFARDFYELIHRTVIAARAASRT